MNMETQKFADRQHIYQHNEEAQKKEETKFKRAIAGAVLIVLTIAGLSYEKNQSDQPDKITLGKDDIDRDNLPKGEKIENNALKVGSKQVIIEGVIEINPKELNVRNQPLVVNPSMSGGDSNLIKLNSKMTVVNPVYVKDDVDGSWWMASDANGKNYYFTGNNGGIVNLDNGKPISNLGASGSSKVEIVATTTAGNVGKDSTGEDQLVGTIVDFKE